MFVNSDFTELLKLFNDNRVRRLSSIYKQFLSMFIIY